MATRSKEDRHLIFALHAQTVNRHICAKFRVAPEHKSEAEIGASVCLSIGGSRQDFSDVEAWIIGPIDYFLASRLFTPDIDGALSVFDRIGDPP